MTLPKCHACHGTGRLYVNVPTLIGGVRIVYQRKVTTCPCVKDVPEKLVGNITNGIVRVKP